MKEPLAFKLRPDTLDEVLGQQHLTGKNMILRRCVEQQRLFSMIFYGPPGCGKTTLAIALAHELNVPYRLFNAVTSNKKDLTDLFEEARSLPGLVIIIDEIHRLNKDKQDLLLPHIESGLITVIGATTSNPYFAINPAIRSRCHLLEVKPLNDDDIKTAIRNALASPKGYNNTLSIDEDALNIIANHSNGDLRYAYNIIEICAVGCTSGVINKELVIQYSPLVNMNMDHSDDGHYDAVSALQKSIRGSDVNAALYYLARLIMANDMDSIERRLTVIAYEDIGLANPAACARTVTAIEAAKKVGFPEGMIPLGDAVIELALSPKSKSGNNAIHAAYDLASSKAYDIPVYLRLTPVGLDDADKYDYADPSKWHRIQYLPDEIRDVEFYKPNTNSSYEKALAENYETLKQYYRTNKLRTLNKK
ncbi:MAG: replication-associated recombination protein A [Erysipelotrichaceae bacterium]|nr:replication-associated recombination protein A [Erysipelotrichaceae bacterium]